MSIYPVRAKKWFVGSSKDREITRDMRTARYCIKYFIEKRKLKCKACGRTIKNYDECYVSHAFMYGYKDTNYCNKRCYEQRVPNTLFQKFRILYNNFSCKAVDIVCRLKFKVFLLYLDITKK